MTALAAKRAGRAQLYYAVAAVFSCTSGASGRSDVTRFSTPPVEACPLGGVRVEVGRDVDVDGVLDPAEVEDRRDACHGAPGGLGTQWIVGFARHEQDPSCIGAALLVLAGPDLDGDGVLQDAEAVERRVLCDGARAGPTLVATESVPPGPDCARGGSRVLAGHDDNGNTRLDADEVSASTLVCAGQVLQALLDPPSLQDAHVGAPFADPLTTIGLVGDVTWRVEDGVLPLGLRLERTTATGARIEGFPRRTGVYRFSVRATDPLGLEARRTYVLTVDDPLAVSTTTLPRLHAGAAYDATLGATGGQPPYRWRLVDGALPLGLSLASDGRVSGIAGEMAGKRVHVEVTDVLGATAEAFVVIGSDDRFLAVFSRTDSARSRNGELIDWRASPTPASTPLGLTDAGSFVPASFFTPDGRWFVQPREGLQSMQVLLRSLENRSAPVVDLLDGRGVDSLRLVERSSSGRWLLIAGVRDNAAALLLADLAASPSPTVTEWRANPVNRHFYAEGGLFSPDERSLVMSMFDPVLRQWRLTLVSLGPTLTTSPLTPPDLHAGAVAWLPDSSGLVFDARQQDALEFRLHLFERDTGLVSMLSGTYPLESPRGSSVVLWSPSPQGRQIVFSSLQANGTRRSACIVAILSRRLRCFDQGPVDSSDAGFLPGAWSPDGRLVATLGPGPSGGRDVRVVDVQATRPGFVKVPSASAPFLASDQPVWRNAGRGLFFRARPGAAAVPGYWSFDPRVDGSALERWTPPSFPDSAFWRVSESGDTLLVSASEPGTFFRRSYLLSLAADRSEPLEVAGSAPTDGGVASWGFLGGSDVALFRQERRQRGLLGVFLASTATVTPTLVGPVIDPAEPLDEVSNVVLPP